MQERMFTAISKARFLRFWRGKNKLKIVLPPRSNHTAFRYKHQPVNAV